MLVLLLNNYLIVPNSWVVSWLAQKGGYGLKTARPHILILTVLIAATLLEPQSQCRRRESTMPKEEPAGAELPTDLGLRADAALMDTNWIHFCF